jgi:beta-glucanase (GH16 family)
MMAAMGEVAGRGRPSWADEFDGPAGAGPDPAVWTHDLGGGGWGCGQLQHYTSSTANASITAEGRLRLTALPAGGDGGAPAITSARLVTRGRRTVRHGRVAARMRVPAGSGLWSAFWMLGEDLDRVGWPACGEIDVMEHVGSDPRAVHGTLHGPGYSGLAGGVGRRHDHGAALSDDFHVYAVDWSPERVTWLLDDVPYSSLTPADVPGPWPFTHPFYLLLNLAVGGAWPGLATGEPALPAALDVDWVRVWEQGAAQEA